MRREGLTLKDRILRYCSLKAHWISGKELEEKALLAGYKASTASRVCRTLENTGKLERNLFRGSVQYRITE